MAQFVHLALLCGFWPPIQAPVIWQVQNSVRVALLRGLFALQQVCVRLRQRFVPEAQQSKPIAAIKSPRSR